jgi:hypothetical protein
VCAADTNDFVRRDAADARRVRRARAFACTRPLHRLEADKGQVHADLAPYPLDQLALDAIELVALNQEFQNGLTRDELTDRLADQASRHAPSRSREEHTDVAQRVVTELLAAHQLRVPELEADGHIGQVVMTLRLLSEHEAVKGRIYLRAGAEAINVLVDRLDIDAASEAQAAELRLRFLVQNRQMRAAQTVAHAMRLLSVQYMEETRRYVDAARRNLAELDWVADVLPHLEGAHRHLEERLAGEQAIIGELEDVLVAPETRDRQAAVDAVGLLRGTHRTHAELLTHLAGVHEAFSVAQDRQQFVLRPLSVRRADLRHDVLGGFMALTFRDAHALFPHPVELLLGAVARPIVTPVAIAARALDVAGLDESNGAGADEPELEHDTGDESRRTALAAYLDAVDGRRLSEILAEAARDLDPASLWTLATMAVEAYGAEHLAVLGSADGEEQHSVPARFLAAFNLAEPLTVAGAGWLKGDDLRFVDVVLLDEDAEP